MRIPILAIYLAAGCSSELVERPAGSDPTNVAAAEAPLAPTPAYRPDPLLNPVTPKSSEPPPLGSEPAHSPNAKPPGNPPLREEPGGKPIPPAVYHCPMHPEVRSNRPGHCPKCGMTLIPGAK